MIFNGGSRIAESRRHSGSRGAVVKLAAVAGSDDPFIFQNDPQQGAHVSDFQVGAELLVAIGVACNKEFLKGVQKRFKCASLPEVLKFLCNQEVERQICPGELLTQTYKPRALFEWPSLNIDFVVSSPRSDYECFFESSVSKTRFAEEYFEDPFYFYMQELGDGSAIKQPGSAPDGAFYKASMSKTFSYASVKPQIAKWICE